VPEGDIPLRVENIYLLDISPSPHRGRKSKVVPQGGSEGSKDGRVLHQTPMAKGEEKEGGYYQEGSYLQGRSKGELARAKIPKSPRKREGFPTTPVRKPLI